MAPLLPQSDNALLYEIAQTLGCHRGMVLETVKRLQKDLRHAQETIQMAYDALRSRHTNLL